LPAAAVVAVVLRFVSTLEMGKIISCVGDVDICMRLCRPLTWK